MPRKTVRQPGAGRPGAGEELEALVLEILGAFFDLRAAGQEQGLVNASGAGTWGLLRLLEDEGPLTVPEVARRRSVSRQYIQKLANELIDEGLVEMVDNPAHRRSKHMQLTGAGARRLTELTGRLRAFLDARAGAIPTARLRAATHTIAELRRLL